MASVGRIVLWLAIALTGVIVLIGSLLYVPTVLTKVLLVVVGLALVLAGSVNAAVLSRRRGGP